MSVEDDLQFFEILEEIDVDDYERQEMKSIRRQNLPVTRGLVKRIKQTRNLRKRREGEKTKIDWSKYSDASFYGHPVDQHTEPVRSRFWDRRNRRRALSQPEVLQRITEVTSEVALRKRRRSHVDVEVTVSPAPSPRMGPIASPDHLLDEGFTIIPDHEVMSDIASRTHRRLNSTDSYFSQPENFEYNSTYETDCEYVHSPVFLEKITSPEESIVNSKPEFEASDLIGMDEMKEAEEDIDAPIFEDPLGDSMESPSSILEPELNSEENDLPFSLAPDGLVDINTLDLGFYEPGPIPQSAPSDLSTATPSSLSLPPETDNHGVEDFLRGLDEVDRFEKDLLQKMADLNRSMHQGFQNVGDILALEDANFRTASESRRARASMANWDSVYFSGNRGSVMSQSEPDSPDFLRSEIEDLKIQNKQLQKEVRHLNRQLTNAKKRLGDEAPPASSFFNSPSLNPCNSDSESMLSELSLALSDLPQFTNQDSSSHEEESHPVREWLKEIDCESCYEIFLDYGIDEISELSNLDDSILHKMQIPLEQKQRILDRIQPHPPRIINENKAQKEQRHLKKEAKYLPEKGIPLSTIWQPVCRFVKRYTWIWQPALFFACIVVNIDFFEANYDG